MGDDARSPSALSHVDGQGRARMVDVGDKNVTRRSAEARAGVALRAETLALIVAGEVGKGDVLAVARVAGIQAAKRAGELIPLCHSIGLTAAEVDFEPDHEHGRLWVRAVCQVEARTGVEMEALTAASVAALTIYDMCKAVEREMRIVDVALIEKSGGRSGTWRRPSEAAR